MFEFIFFVLVNLTEMWMQHGHAKLPKHNYSYINICLTGIYQYSTSSYVTRVCFVNLLHGYTIATLWHIQSNHCQKYKTSWLYNQTVYRRVVKVIVTIKFIYHLLFKLIIRKIQKSTVAGNTFIITNRPFVNTVASILPSTTCQYKKNVYVITTLPQPITETCQWSAVL